MRRAVIDIGTKTIKLLVADVGPDGGIDAVLARDLPTRLGEGLGTTGHASAPAQSLAPVAIERTISAIQQFANDARVAGTVNIVAISTSAVRDASNRDAFVDGVRDRCGLDVRVVTGDEEARLIFRGVCSDPAWAGAKLLARR